jgi:hypothetical protein
MSNVNEQRQKKLEKTTFGPQVSGVQKKKYPSLAQALAGIKDAAGAVVLPSFNVTLYAGEDEIRFLLKSQSPRETWFGPACRSDDILGHVDACIGSWDLQQVREKEGQENGRRH